MGKKFYLFQLQNLNSNEIAKISKAWGIKSTKSIQKSIEKIYNHENNQIQNQKIKPHQNSKPFCKASSLQTCCRDNCQKHLQSKFENGGFGLKIVPTKFHRAPLPICWAVAGIQFLSGIKWPAACYNFVKDQPAHKFSKFFHLIEIAKLDASENTFKAAHIAQLFIEHFKPTAQDKKWIGI